MSVLKDSPIRWEDFVADEKALKHPASHPDKAGNCLYQRNVSRTDGECSSLDFCIHPASFRLWMNFVDIKKPR